MNKVLVANRGEIARRVIRTLKIMNIKSVAIYSDADKNALHVQEADESVYMGKSPASESYLLQDKIIEYCKIGFFGIPNTRVTHGKSQGQITVSSLGPATARPLIDEKNVYSLGD